MITVKFYCNDRHLFEERYDSQERRDDEVAVWMKWNEDTAGTEDVHIHHFEEISDEQPDPDPARGSEGERWSTLPSRHRCAGQPVGNARAG